MKRTLLVILGTALTVAGLLGSAWVWRYRAIQDATYYSDGDSIRTPARSAPVRDILWQPARALGHPVNSADDEYEPRLSGDGRSLFFVRGRPDEDADIYLSTRTPDGWTEPVPIDAVNTAADELGPAPSFDGSTLLFYSDRRGGFGGFDLWRISRQADGTWGEAENLGPAVNTPFNDYGPALSPDGGTLYFASNRPRRGERTTDLADGWPATLRDDYLQQPYDIYASTVSADGFGPASAVDALNSPHNEGAPVVNPFASFLYFASDRPGGTGGYDLFRVRIRDGTLEQPRRLGHAVNSPFNDLDPTLGLGGFELLFSSDRPVDDTEVSAKAGDDDAPPDYNIFRTTSREVYTQIDAAQAAMDWVGLWSAFWPVLLLLALLLLGLLMLRRLWASERFQVAYYRLNLLAKCLLFSVLAHLLLASVLAVWSVSTQIGDFLQPSSGTKVALISRSGGELVAQIRGSLTAVQIETPEPESQARLALDQLSIGRPAVATVAMAQTIIEEELTEPPERVADADSASPDAEPIALVAPSPADDAPAFDTPRPSEPDAVVEAQMAPSPQDAGDVASRPMTPIDAVVASAIPTATGAATIDDARSVVRADAAPDATPDRSQIQPGPMIAMPDPAMLEPETATPNDSNAQQTVEAGLTVPSAPTRDVRSRATSPSDTPDVMTAILDAPPSRPDTSADESMATLDPGTVESRVDVPTPQQTKQDLARLDVARAVAAEVNAPDESLAVATGETDLTVPTIATRPVQRDSTVPGVELDTATAVLETERLERGRP
ncbi:MAG: PD40 domain-containing protein, partial [Planctomycetes bacterium]|nr:PD40 domain-containing protein [Planctomycetota bacterium]